MVREPAAESDILSDHADGVMFCMFHIAYVFIIFGQRQHEG